MAEVLEAVGLRADDARRYPSDFSGGQRQRIAIARAIVSHIKGLMRGDPAIAGDAKVRLTRRLGA